MNSIESRKNIGRLKYAIDMLLADGKGETMEILYVNALANKLNVSNDIVVALVKDRNAYESLPPETKAEKMQVLSDVIHVMMIDGKADTREILKGAIVSKQIGISIEVFTEMAKFVIRYKQLMGFDYKDAKLQVELMDKFGDKIV